MKPESARPGFSKVKKDFFAVEKLSALRDRLTP